MDNSVNICMVDDDVNQQYLMEQRVKSHNESGNQQVILTSFNNPVKFLDSIGVSGNIYDVVVLDATMILMTGPEVLDKMKELNNANCVILFFTSLIGMDEARSCVVSKEDQKPVEAFLDCFNKLKDDHVSNIFRLSVRSAELNRKINK